MQCNIDFRGRALRTTMGILTGLIGGGAVGGWYLGVLPNFLPYWTLGIGIALLLGGAFMIFEGVNGWCAVRAMGFKTPI
ncbi:MAG: hypothetical protein NT089_04910 [Planctomycetia bacterium]|nr:hypothetical protein [Planctomycetia bacterium]